MSPSEARRLPGALELAFLGDAVYELAARELASRGGGRIKSLHERTVKLVCAKAQSEAYGRIEPILDEEELAIARRARNTKQTTPKHADPADYRRSTALEAVIGHLYRNGNERRLKALLACALETDQGVDDAE